MFTSLLTCLVSARNRLITVIQTVAIADCDKNLSLPNPSCSHRWFGVGTVMLELCCTVHLGCHVWSQCTYLVGVLLLSPCSVLSLLTSSSTPSLRTRGLASSRTEAERPPCCSVQLLQWPLDVLQLCHTSPSPIIFHDANAFCWSTAFKHLPHGCGRMEIHKSPFSAIFVSFFRTYQPSMGSVYTHATLSNAHGLAHHFSQGNSANY